MAVSRSLTLGLLANEFFDRALGRMGGFGWAVSRLADLFTAEPELQVRPIVFAGERLPARLGAADVVHGASFVPRTWNAYADARRLKAERPDVLIAIDYRPSYDRCLRALADVPTIVWIRDPRTPEDSRLVSSIVVPGDETTPQGLETVTCDRLAKEVERRRRARRELHLAVTDPFLIPKILPTYGVSADDVPVLPNPIPPGASHPVKATRPRVVFLGRLDPYKRPWIFVALAERWPDVEFLMMGQPHFTGPGAWQPRGLPPNVRLVGHADGQLKREILASAWVLANTSVHEGLAVSFLEALSFETPLLATVDAGGLVSRFGVRVVGAPGTGLEELDALSSGLERLLGDRPLREAVGRSGREWVEQHHSRDAFLAAFARLLNRCGIRQ
jgi:glycosyltransferase involved in cell wall biosynthesis